MKVLQIQAFGKLQMQYAGKVVDSFPTHHVEELLGYLLLNRGVAHSREKLITLLWPHSDSQRIRGRFSTALWRLRSSLEELGIPPDSCLETTRDWVLFSPAQSIELDLDSFTHHLTEAQLATDDIAYERALQAALRLYRGELYEGLYADWCLIERERLARLHLRTLGQLMTCYMQKQAYEKAEELGQKILQEDPLREEVHRALMICYGRMGQRAKAAQQFQECAQRLMQELHILPMSETIAVYRQIVEARLQSSQQKADNTLLQARLRAAFSQFQQAGDKLNTLLNRIN